MVKICKVNTGSKPNKQLFYFKMKVTNNSVVKNIMVFIRIFHISKKLSNSVKPKNVRKC